MELFFSWWRRWSQSRNGLWSFCITLPMPSGPPPRCFDPGESHVLGNPQMAYSCCEATFLIPAAGTGIMVRGTPLVQLVSSCLNIKLLRFKKQTNKNFPHVMILFPDERNRSLGIKLPVQLLTNPHLKLIFWQMFLTVRSFVRSFMENDHH